jgi:TP901 family phage tail tape measure protein
MAINQTANFVVKAKDSASGPLGKIGGSMGKLAKTSSAAFGGIAAGTAVIGAVVGALTYAVGKAAAFETAMLNVNSIAKVSPKAFEELKDAVLDLSTKLPQSAETLAQGLYDISSSGFAGAEGIKVLEAAAKAASAGLAQTSESAAGITAVLNAYSYSADEAQRVSDILFKVVDRGVITFPQLASEIGKVTALSAPLGVSLEDVAAGIAVLTKNGIDAENATTQLNAIMQAVLSPTAKATKLAKQLGIDFTATGLKTKGLNGFMADLIKKTGGSNEKIAELLGDARAIRGAFVLAKNSGAQFNQELEIMANAAGATDTALSYQEQGLNYQLQIFQNKVDAIAVAIGTALLPSVNFLLESLTNMGAGMDRVIQESVNPFLDELGETAKLLGIDFGGGIDQESFWDTFFKPIRDNFDNARIALSLFNDAYREMLRLTGQPIPGEGIKGLDPMSDKYGFRQYETTNPNGTGGATTVTTTVNIGTEKVDKVVSNSIRRIGFNPRAQ